MQPVVRKVDQRAEYFFKEGCHILELSNTSDDPTVSIARARVAPGVTTRRHCLRGITERYVILEGKGRVEVADRVAQAVGPGDVVFVPPNASQCIANIGIGDLVFLAVCTPRFVDSAYEDIDG